MIKNWKKYLPIIGLLLFVYILMKIDLSNILNEIRNINIYFLLMAVVFVVIMFAVQTFKWHIIAVFQDIKIPFRESFKINMVGHFYGLVTPSKLGSIVRVEYLKKYNNNNIGKGLFNFVIDKMLDISSVIFLAVIFSFIFRDKLKVPISFFTALFFAFVLITLFFLKKERSRLVLRFFYNRLNKNFKNKARLTFESFYEDIPKKRYFILFFLLNIINWILIYLVVYFIGLSVGIELNFIFYLAILPIGTLVSMIPISIGGLGTREAVLISLFGLFGMAASKVFSMSLINFLIAGVIPAAISILFVWKKKL